MTAQAGFLETSVRNEKSPPDLANVRALPNLLMHFIVRAEDTGGSFALLEGYGRPGMEAPAHTHSNEDEGFYLLSGKLWFRIGDTEIVANPGDFVFLPRNIRHDMKVLSDEFNALVFIMPGRYEEFLWQFSAPAESYEIPPEASEPPSQEFMAKMMQVSAEYGVSY